MRLHLRYLATFYPSKDLPLFDGEHLRGSGSSSLTFWSQTKIVWFLVSEVRWWNGFLLIAWQIEWTFFVQFIWSSRLVRLAYVMSWWTSTYFGFIDAHWSVWQRISLHCVPRTTVSFQKHAARSEIDRFPIFFSLNDH